MSLSRTELLEPAFLARLERLDLNVRKLLVGDRRGDTSTARRGAGTLYRDHRRYVPGDDPRFLDWHAYLRLGDLLIKEFEAEESPRLLLLVDRSGSMALGGGARFDLARQVAAAVGAIGLFRHVAVRCVLFPGTGQAPTLRGRASLPRLLQGLASVEPEGETRFLAAFQAACPPGKPGGLAMVLSDFLETSEHATALRLLRHRGYQAYALHLTDPKDQDVRAGDVIELVDAETGRKLRERIDKRMVDAYRQAIASHFRAVEETCRSLQVGYIRVSVQETLERVVADLFRRGALAR